jgi:serine/threonine protein kinase
VDRTFGRYRITGELGRGAMGEVFRAVDPLIEREVAIKTLLSDLPAEVADEVRERFLREARSAGRLNHPNIVIIYDVGEQAGVAYIAMELLEGSSLQALLRGGKRLPFATIADICAQVADALDHAQKYSIVHRDVKPANVMVAPSGRCKLTDFGVAYVPTSTMTQTGAALGSPRYMSPEQALGVAVDGRSDVFSLGVMLYEMLAGKNPFQRDTDTTPIPVLHRICSEPHAPVRSVDPGIPPAFENILTRALAKKPEGRYQRAGEMAQALRQAGNEPATASAYEKTVAVGPSAYEKTVVVKPHSISDQLLGDLDAFTRKLDEEEQALKQAAEAERAAREAMEAKRRAEIERQRIAAPVAAEPPAEATVGRRGALEALRKQAATIAPKLDPAAQRASAMLALDQDLRATYRYLAEFGKEANSVCPASSGAYEFPFLGRMPTVALSETWVDSRPRIIEEKDYTGQVTFKYTVAPQPPLALRLSRDEIPRFTEFLQSLKADFELKVEAKNDFGQPLRGVLTVKGKLPCQIELRGDYAAMAVQVDVLNVRRYGRAQCRVPAAEVKDLGDELARYMLGVDDDFGKRLQKN